MVVIRIKKDLTLRYRPACRLLLFQSKNRLSRLISADAGILPRLAAQQHFARLDFRGWRLLVCLPGGIFFPCRILFCSRLPGRFFHQQVEIPQVPEGGTAVNRAAEVSDGQIATSQKYLRIGDIGPRGKPYFFGRGIMLKISFYLFRVHGAKLGKKCCPVKGAVAYRADCPAGRKK